MAPARAALRAGVDAAEAGRIEHELAGVDEALSTLGGLERERHDHAARAHLEPTLPQGARDCLRVRTLSCEADPEGRERAVRQPGLERPGDGAGARTRIADLLRKRLVS